VRGPDNRAFARKFLQATLLNGSKHVVLATNPWVGQTFLSVLFDYSIPTGKNAYRAQAVLPVLQLRSLTNMQRRNSAGKIPKSYLAKTGLL
jgi:hypothetical protein